VFVDFVAEGVDYFEGGAIDVKSNMPAQTLQRMRDVLAEARRMRQFYLM
jgi:hypothetical protein